MLVFRGVTTALITAHVEILMEKNPEAPDKEFGLGSTAMPLGHQGVNGAVSLSKRDLEWKVTPLKTNMTLENPYVQ